VLSNDCTPKYPAVLHRKHIVHTETDHQAPWQIYNRAETSSERAHQIDGNHHSGAVCYALDVILAARSLSLDHCFTDPPQADARMSPRWNQTTLVTPQCGHRQRTPSVSHTEKENREAAHVEFSRSSHEPTTSDEHVHNQIQYPDESIFIASSRNALVASSSH
jgi:hypothetical protein